MSEDIGVDVYCNGSEYGVDTFSNTTLCPAEERCYELSNVSHGALVTHGFFLALNGILSFLANGLVLLLVVKYKRLRNNISILLALLLVVSDLSLTFTYVFPAFVTAIFKEWIFGEAGCIAFGFLAADVLLTRWMIIGLFCVDRFSNVKFPFTYQKRRKPILISLSVAAWLVPAVATLIPIHSFADFNVRANIPTCLPSCTINNPLSNLCKGYYFITGIVSFVMGSILPTILYSWLYCKGKSARMSVRNSIGQITVQVAGGIIKRPYTDYKVIIDRDKRATVTFLLVFITVLLTAAPTFLAQAIRAINFKAHCNLTVYVHFAITHILLFAFILNPIFIMRDADFRHCLKHLFCCKGTCEDAIASNSFTTRTTNTIQEMQLDNIQDSGEAKTLPQDFPEEQEVTLQEVTLEYLELPTDANATVMDDGVSCSSV